MVRFVSWRGVDEVGWCGETAAEDGGHYRAVEWLIESQCIASRCTLSLNHLFKRIHLLRRHKLALLEHEDRIALRRKHGCCHATARSRAYDDRVDLELGVLGFRFRFGFELVLTTHPHSPQSHPRNPPPLPILLVLTLSMVSRWLFRSCSFHGFGEVGVE